MNTVKACIAIATLIALPIASAGASVATPSDTLTHIAQRCAPNVSAHTMRDIVAVESKGHRLAINVNGHYRLPRQPANEQEAIATIQWLEQQGYNFDVGYAQINSANFEWLGVTGPRLLDGCENLRAAAAVLTECYSRAVKAVGEGQTALKRAISCYNTGSFKDGFTNGYVTKVASAAKKLHVPALETGRGQQPAEVQPSANPPVSSGGDPEPKQTGAPGAFDHPDRGAFAANSDNTATGNRNEQSQNASLSDSAQATQSDSTGRRDQDGRDLSAGSKKVDARVQRDRTGR